MRSPPRESPTRSVPTITPPTVPRCDRRDDLRGELPQRFMDSLNKS